MESKSVRKIDIFNILKYVLKKWTVVLIVAIITAGLFGGYEFFMYKVQAKNELYVNANKVELVYGSYIIYVNNFDDSDNYYNRLEDVNAIITGHGCLGEVIEKHKLPINYSMMTNCVAIVPVGINQMEISFEGSLVGLSQDEVVAVTESLYEVTVGKLKDYFGEECVTVIEEPHAGAYELQKATTIEESEKITKKTVLKYGILGGMAGVVLGVILVIFYVLVSTVLRTKNEVVESYGLPLLGAVDKAGTDKEEYKRAVKRIKDKAVLAFISVSDSEYRREAATGVATSMAVNGAKAVVIKIDEDTEDKAKNPLYGFVSGKGDVKSMLTDTANASVKTVNWTQASSEDIDLFTNKKFVEAIEDLRTMFEYVVIDCPAMKTSAAGLNVAAVCDGVVVVGSSGVVKEKDVDKLKYNLSENDIKPLGLLYIE